MNINLKRYFATGIALATLLVSASTAFAESSATVVDDGDAFAKNESESKIIVKNDNDDADLFNVDLGAGVSGVNFQSGNDDGNEMGTGSADGSAETENYANSNIVKTEVAEDAGSADSTAEVGDDGSAKALAFEDSFVGIFNENDADAFNVTAGLAVSGINFQNDNDDDNSMVTGSTVAEATTLNELNSNWVTISGDEDAFGAEATATVGDDGKAFALAKDESKVIVKNENDGRLFNATLAAAVSGVNFQSGNDDGNSMETGSATATSGAENYINNNITVVKNGNGGTVAATSEVSDGEDKDKSTSIAESESTVKVSNENDADVVNISAGAAVSGGNTQSGNDDTNSLTTGSASGTSSSINTVNSNWTGIGADPGCPKP